MKSRHYFLMALCACCSALFVATDAVAQRVKPTLPEPDSIRAGEYYYLWNEGAQMFVGKDWSYSDYDYSYYKAMTTTPDLTFCFNKQSDGTYKIIQSNGYFLNGYYDLLTAYSGSYSYSELYFRMHKQEDGTYTIQRNYNYNATYFVAPWNENEGSSLYTNVTDSTYIKWQLIPVSYNPMNLVGTTAASWNTSGNTVSIDGISMPEKYEETTATLGDVMWQTVTGLENGTYTVELYANARYTPDRGFETAATDGQMNCTYLFANNVELSIPVVFNEELNNGLSYTLENVEVTDGTLKMGMTKKADGSNWHTIQIKALTPNFEYASSDNDLQVARMGLYLELEKLDSTFNVELYDEILANSTSAEELIEAAKQLRTANDFTNGYTQKSYSYPLIFINDTQYPWSVSGNKFYSYHDYYQQSYKSRMKAIVEVVDDEATLVYTVDADYNNTEVNIYIDGALARTIPWNVRNQSRKFYDRLDKGVHTIEWECVDHPNYDGEDVRISDIYVEPTPTINVSLLEPGSLGTEVLAQVNHVKDVRRLKIKGEMNAEDWANLQLMPSIYSVDLSEAVITEIPDKQFYGMVNFHQVVLPEGLTRIGKNAFDGTEVEEVNFPSTLKEIAYASFYNTLLVKALIPESVTSIGDAAFARCRALLEVSYPSSLTYIPAYCFESCNDLRTFDLPENLETIGESAFNQAYNFVYKAVFPESLKSIGKYSFQNSRIDTLMIPEGVSIGDYAFCDCINLKYAELPTTYNYATTYCLFHGCYNLETIRLKSPTVAVGDWSFINNDYRANITLQVPDYLVSSYKLNTYWYNYGNIEGFATSEIDTWTINAPLTLNATARFQGSPNIILGRTSLIMKGETGMEVSDFWMSLDNDYYSRYSSSSQVLMSAPTDVTGTLALGYGTRANRWYYIALPFDIRVGDIQTSAQYAIRYYDGANRAATSAASGNWKNYTADDIIPAGTGFVFQTSKSVSNTFVAYESTNKSRAFDTKDLSTPLQENACDVAAHKGWNLVGNPWMTWFNIHTVDFTAPITVYDQYNSRYQAYSIIDDDIALHPTQAFFVQCPEDVDAITFPARGRQLTSEITDQNGARSISSARRLTDVELCMGEMSDQTRIVMNESTTLEYDYGSDASKFFADANTVQLYTLDNNGDSYAINERPTDDCIVPLAYIAPTAGDYTLKLTRNQAGRVVLKDLLLDTETPLTEEGYTFTTDGGTCTDRFQLLFTSIGAMGIEGLQVMPEVNATDGGIQTKGAVQVFTTDGRLIAEGEGFLPLQKGFYVVRAQGESKKVVIK